MNHADDPFLPLAAGTHADVFATLAQRPATVASGVDGTLPHLTAPAVARLHGFDLLGQAHVSGVSRCPGELIAARSTVPLRHAMIGCDVLVIFENGDVHQPIIVGVLEPRPLQAAIAPQAGLATHPTAVQVDGERQVIQAEREVVLRCGDASITLTRAGKVIIRGHYILSRSTGYNKIKGAAIDIN